MEIATTYPRWSWRDAVLIILFFMIVYGLSVPLQFGVASLTGELEKFENSENPSIPESALIINHIGKAIGLVGGMAWVCHRKNYGWAEIGFRPTTRQWLILSVGLAIILFPVRLLLAKGFVAIMPELENGAGGVFLNNSYSWYYNIALLIIISIVVPLTEEMFYRGFLYTWMRSHRPLWAAILFSSVMFGMSHFVPIQIIMSIMLSLVITIVFEKSRSLWNAIAIHAANNFIGVSLSLLLPLFGVNIGL